VGFHSVKRVLDVVLALSVLPFFAFACVLLALLNPVLNPGPLLFSQTRVGKGGVRFDIVKFRTVSACGRVSPFANWLRLSRIDELPQVLLILRGEMTFVGPRPLCVYEVVQFNTFVPGFDRRHSVVPGLTGLAQIRQGHTTGIPAARRKLAWDRLYIRHQSLRFDLFVLMGTLRCVASQHSSKAKDRVEMDPLHIMQ